MRVFLLLVLALAIVACGPRDYRASKIEGEQKVWHPVTLSFEGPKVLEERTTFTDYSLRVLFTRYYEPGNGEDPIFENVNVEGYYAGDGNTWQVKFVPNLPGNWVYQANLTAAPNIILSEGAIENITFNRIYHGNLPIEETALDSIATDFRKKGMLQDVKGRYLQFSGIKEYFLKTGVGSPENILAYSGFDGTYDVGGTEFPALGENQLHEFEPHLKDAREGDPTWGEGKGKAILGIANYYEEVGVNAQYLVTMNVEGDGQDVFPWVSHDDPYVFDVSKLSQWQRVFEHFNARGVLIDMLLTETENESWFEAIDGVEVGKDFSDSRKLYYREMVARFGHLNGLVFNLGEENGVVGNSGQDPFRQPTSVEQRREFTKYIRNLDPYGHAVVSHNWPDAEEETYGPLLGDDDFSGISLQAHYDYFKTIAKWTDKSAKAGRGWMVTADEPLGWEYGAQPDSVDAIHEREIEGVLWPTLMAGGAGVDWYFGWQNNASTSDLSNEDQRSRHNLWVTSSKVRKFFENNFDLTTMKSSHTEDYLNLVFAGKNLEGRDVELKAQRRLPNIPEGEGHNPWEYELESLTLAVNGEIRDIDPLKPQ